MLNLTPFLKLYAKQRMARINSYNPADIQQQQLRGLISKAANTRFGRDHNFGQIRTVEQYQQKVPLRRYEEFWNQYWKEPFPNLKDCTWPGLIPYFPVSSGTSSGTTKYLPCTHEMIKSNTKAGLDLLVYHLHNNPDSKLFGGKNFILGGSTELVEEAPGVWSGDLSGIAVKTLPWWAKIRYYPPQKLALLKDWEEKIDIFTRQTPNENIRMISGVPSWLLIFFHNLLEKNPGKQIADIYPDLEMLVHGGVNFAPYKSQFDQLLDGSKCDYREVYPASEGFIATADRGYGEGLRVNLDNGLFYEFVPVEELDSDNPTRHWIKNIEKDVNYAIILSTCAGAWSYIIGDTVRFIDTEVPRLLVTGRTSYYMSAFGEHLIAEEVEDAVAFAAGETNTQVHDYSMGALYPQDPSKPGGHLFIVEFEEIPAESALKEFSNKVDQKLCQRNEDYEAHRANGFGLNPPQIQAVPSGTFAEWMKSRGKLGGQNKVPRIISSSDLFSNLREFVRSN